MFLRHLRGLFFVLARVHFRSWLERVIVTFKLLHLRRSVNWVLLAWVLQLDCLLDIWVVGGDRSGFRVCSTLALEESLLAWQVFTVVWATPTMILLLVFFLVKVILVFRVSAGSVKNLLPSWFASWLPSSGGSIWVGCLPSRRWVIYRGPFVELDPRASFITELIIELDLRVVALVLSWSFFLIWNFIWVLIRYELLSGDFHRFEMSLLAAILTIVTTATLVLWAKSSRASFRLLII
jgi:hypothetical protein